MLISLDSVHDPKTEIIEIEDLSNKLLSFCSIEYKEYSQWSIIIIFFGRSFKISAHSSEPIDPPAPVIQTLEP